ncbi:hypothetical protein ACFQZ4_46265 [Catellatospora coxensis]
MRARDLATACPTVTLATPVIEVITRVAERGLLGVVIVDDAGRPYGFCPEHGCSSWRCRPTAWKTRSWRR